MKVLTLVIVVFFPLLSYAIDLSAPKAFLGSASRSGYVTEYLDLGEIEVLPEIALPIRLAISSEEKDSSSFAGQLSKLLIFDSRVNFEYDYAETTLLCGKRLLLKKNDEGVFEGDGWRGQRIDGEFTMSASGNWESVYDANTWQLLSLDVPDGPKLTFNRSTNQSSITDQDGNTLLAFRWVPHRKAAQLWIGTSVFWQLDFENYTYFGKQFEEESSEPSDLDNFILTRMTKLPEGTKALETGADKGWPEWLDTSKSQTQKHEDWLSHTPKKSNSEYYQFNWSLVNGGAEFDSRLHTRLAITGTREPAVFEWDHEKRLLTRDNQMTYFLTRHRSHPQSQVRFIVRDEEQRFSYHNYNEVDGELLVVNEKGEARKTVFGRRLYDEGKLTGIYTAKDVKVTRQGVPENIEFSLLEKNIYDRNTKRLIEKQFPNHSYKYVYDESAKTRTTFQEDIEIKVEPWNPKN